MCVCFAAVLAIFFKASWDAYAEMFGPTASEGSLEDRTQIESELKLEWERYLQVFVSDYVRDTLYQIIKGEESQCIPNRGLASILGAEAKACCKDTSLLVVAGVSSCH